YNYSSERLLSLVDRIKERIREKDNQAEPSTGRGSQAEVLARAAREKSQGLVKRGPGNEEGDEGKLGPLTAPIKSVSMHMPAHLLEMEDSGPEKGIIPTGRATPLRPFGAEDMPGDNSRFQSGLTADQKQHYLNGLDYAINKMTDGDKEV